MRCGCGPAWRNCARSGSPTEPVPVSRFSGEPNRGLSSVGLQNAGLHIVVCPTIEARAGPANLLAHPTRLVLQASFRHWAAVYGVPPGLLEAVGWMESGWQTNVVSKTKAVGVGQIEPPTAEFISTQLLGLAKPLDARIPDSNIRMSAVYLAWLLHQTGGNVANALGSYYQGLTTLRAKGPLTVTRRYVAGVGALWALFRSG